MRLQKGFAKFASKHANLVLTTAVTTLTAVGGTVYVANSYKEADGTNGGALIKQNVAEKDAKGDLRMKM